jgi:hypothetical protein
MCRLKKFGKGLQVMYKAAMFKFGSCKCGSTVKGRMLSVSMGYYQGVHLFNDLCLPDRSVNGLWECYFLEVVHLWDTCAMAMVPRHEGLYFGNMENLGSW